MLADVEKKAKDARGWGRKRGARCKLGGAYSR